MGGGEEGEGLAIEVGLEGILSHLGGFWSQKHLSNTYGLRAGFSHGVLGNLDLGFRFFLDFGWGGIERGQADNISYANALLTSVKLQAFLEAKLFDTGFLSLAFKFEPGVWVDFCTGETTIGLEIPVGMQLGLAFSQRVRMGIFLEVPMLLEFGKKAAGNSLLIPILMGAGVDILFTPRFLLNVSLAMGPAMHVVGEAWKNSDEEEVVFAAEAKVGVAFLF